MSALPSFHPPARVLMGPGPSDVPPRVLEAMSRPTIGHLDPRFVALMDDVKARLKAAFLTENEMTMAISAPGSAGMEACFVNLVEPGAKVVVCINGVFGTRMKENVIRCGAEPVIVEDEWGRAVDPQKVEDALKAHPEASVVAFVHAETSTGARSDAATICEIARRHGALTIMDAVTSLGGSEVRIDDWGVDAVYSGTQKCLSCAPGLSPVSFSERALDFVRSRRSPVQSWFLDLSLVMGYWGSGASRAYHHTAPVNAIYGLHEALGILLEEGLEQAWARHELHHRALKAGLEALGLSFVVPEGERLVQLNAVTIPEGVDDGQVRARLLADFGLEIGAGLGALAGKVWRIGLMGHSCKKRNVLLCLSALESVLASMQAPIATGVAADAAMAVLDGQGPQG